MRITVLCFGTLLVLGLAGIGWTADESSTRAQTIDLWPGTPPGEPKDLNLGPEQAKTKDEGKTVTSLTNVTKPTLKVYRPEKDKSVGVAIVVCPGGGYTNLAWDHEGEQVARWLNSLGVTAAVLKYRVPRRADTPKGQPPVQALMDCAAGHQPGTEQGRGLGVDPERVGILGFSAGGHLGAWASTNYDKRAYEAVDAADRTELRPDFAVLIYPGGVIKPKTEQLAPEIRVTSQTPPTFLVHATKDGGSENTIFYYLAPEARWGSRRGPPVRQRRARLRHATQPRALRRLDPAVRGLAPVAADPQGQRLALNRFATNIGSRVGVVGLTYRLCAPHTEDAKAIRQRTSEGDSTSMKSNPVKRALRDGGVALGTFLFEFNTTGIARIVAAAGAEFAIFDMEHTGWTIETIRMLIATSGSAALVPMVRVPATEYHFIARVSRHGGDGHHGADGRVGRSGASDRRIGQISP